MAYVVVLAIGTPDSGSIQKHMDCATWCDIPIHLARCSFWFGKVVGS